MELGDLLEKSKENDLAKVNCLRLQIQEKPFRMFWLAYNLPKTMSNLCPSRLRRKKWGNKNNVHISTIEITLIKVPGNNVDFRPSKKLHRKSTPKWRGIRRNLVFDVSAKYPRRIDVDSLWCACWGSSFLKIIER